MQPGYVFALVFLGLAVFNGFRSIWFYRQQQKIMLVFSLSFLAIALAASGYMAYTVWQQEKKQATEANETQVAPAEGPYSQTQ